MGGEMSRGLYQCPRCGGPSGGPGDCRDCLRASPARGLIQWLPGDWRLTEPGADLAAAMNYMRRRYDQSAALLFARIDFAVRRDSELTPDEQLARALATPWCEPDGCPASVCGGPHFRVEDPAYPGEVVVIAPAGTSPADLEAALGYARHMHGEPEEDPADDDDPGQAAARPAGQ